MKPFTVHEGLVFSMNRANIDTDQIIPKQFLKLVQREGFGQYLFYNWRFDDEGAPRKDFPLNVPPFDKATIMVAGENFGCGSSREHAAWALEDFGFRAILAPSFADIFYSNAFQSGILPITLPEADLAPLHERAAKGDLHLKIDLEALTIIGGGSELTFSLDPFRRRALLSGLDSVGLTLEHAQAVDAFEAAYDPYAPST